MLMLILLRISNCTVIVNDNVSTCFSLYQSVNSCYANVLRVISLINYSEVRCLFCF
jgi:hypothetical protein